MKHHRNHRPGRWIALAAAVLLVACAQLRAPLSLVSGNTPFTEEDLQAELAAYVVRFTSVMGVTVERIIESAEQREVRKRAILWRIRTVPVVYEAATQRDPRTAYVGVLTLVVLMRQYFTEGEGTEHFEEQQPLAVAAMRELEEDLVEIGARFLSAEQLQAARAGVEDFAQEHPLRRGFTLVTAQQALDEVGASDRFGWVVAIPMSPFRALEGVSSGAAAIREFNQTARVFSTVVAGLPDQIRWQAELLLYGVEDRDTIVTGLAAFESLAESAQRASRAIELLPDDLRSALGGSEETLLNVERALEKARLVAEPLSVTAEHLQTASASWASVLQREPGGDRTGREFDIREWESAVREIGASATQLEGAATAIQELLQARGGSALQEVSGVVESARGSAFDVVDYAALRVFLLIVSFFVLLLLYRFLATRMAKS